MWWIVSLIEPPRCRVSSLLPNKRGPRFRQHQRAAPLPQQPAARVPHKPACNTGLSRNRHRGEMRETATTTPPIRALKAPHPLTRRAGGISSDTAAAEQKQRWGTRGTSFPK